MGAQATDETQPRRVALVIGNSSYQHAPLKNPKRDAEAITKSLQSVGFEVTMKLDRTKFQMEDDIDAVTDGLASGDAVLFFYAGHGLEVENNNYLVPIDASVKRKHHVTQRCVRADYITQAMEGSGASLRVIVFDACRNNPFRSFVRSGKVGLATMQAPEGTIIAYSTAAGTEAADGEGDNSPFAKHFVDTVAADHPRGLEVTDLFRSVARQMKKETGQRAFLDLDASMEHYLLKEATDEIAVSPVKERVAPVPAKVKPYKDYRKLDIEKIREHADLGIAAAQAQLGFMYIEGVSPLAKDYKLGLQWTKRAADQHNARALNNLGVIYTDGKGVPADATEAVKYYRRSAALHDRNGLHSLGVAYEKGLGIEQDFEKARKLFLESAELGNHLAEYELGHMYEFGEGFDANLNKAFQWYLKSAESGYKKAQFSIALMYMNGSGVSKDTSRAEKWFKRAAAQGMTNAQLNLGLMYRYGLGGTLDMSKARQWLQKAANGGNTRAQNELSKIGH
jgi:TPR repeat protein